MPAGAEMRGDRRALQAVVALLATIPTAAGLAGCVLGPGLLSLQEPWPADLDSHFRFLSGIFTMVGVGFLTCLPDIERKTCRFRLLAALVCSGGAARLLSLLAVGSPTLPHLAGLGMELLVVPWLVLWQASVASRYV
jgi:Domain of unknown function (DUF4345)